MLNLKPKLDLNLRLEPTLNVTPEPNLNQHLPERKTRMTVRKRKRASSLACSHFHERPWCPWTENAPEVEGQAHRYRHRMFWVWKYPIRSRCFRDWSSWAENRNSNCKNASPGANVKLCSFKSYGSCTLFPTNNYWRPIFGRVEMILCGVIVRVLECNLSRTNRPIQHTTCIPGVCGRKCHFDSCPAI